jgi:hypothetical protein
MQARPPIADPSPPDATPGLPGFRSWRAVYAFVFGCFVLWIVLLAVFSRLFA